MVLIRTLVCQSPLSMEFSRQEYLSGLPFPTPGDLPNPGIQLTSPALVGKCFTTEPPGKPYVTNTDRKKWGFIGKY